MREKVVARFAGKVFGGGKQLNGATTEWSLRGEEIIALYDALAAADEAIRASGNSQAAASSRAAICEALGVRDCADRKADAALGKLRVMGAIEYVTPQEQYPGGPRTRRWQVAK